MAQVPSVPFFDPFSASIDDVYSNKIGQPPRRSEWQKISPNGNVVTPQGTTFNIFPPSNMTLVDSRIYMEAKIKVSTITNAAVTALAPAGALRAYPLNLAITQSNVVINSGGSFITNNSELIYAMQHTIPQDDQNDYGTPTAPDMSGDLRIYGGDQAHLDFLHGSPFVGQLFTDGVGTTVQNVGGAGCGYGTRNTNIVNEVKSAANVAGVKEFVVHEPLLNSVLGDTVTQKALVNISKMEITLLFDPNLTSIWSTFGIGDGVTTEGERAFHPLTVEITDMVLWVHYVTSNLTTVPSPFIVPFKQYTFNRFPQTLTTIANNQATTITNITMNTVPTFIYFYIRPQRNDFVRSGVVTGGATFNAGTSVGQGFGRITNLTVNVGTSLGHLSQMNELALYQLSRENGLKRKDLHHTQKMGSVIIIDCLKDLGLIPGKNLYLPLEFVFQSRIAGSMPTFADNAAINACVPGISNYEAVVLAVFDGKVSITPDGCYSSLGFAEIDENNAAATEASGDVKSELAPEPNPSGSGFHNHGGKITWNGVWKVFKKVGSVGKKGLDIAAQMSGDPRIQAASMAANAIANAASGQGYHKRRKTGRGLLMA